MDSATLNKQAITCAKHYMGKTAWPTVALTLAVVVAFVLTLFLFASGMLPAWAAFLAVATLTYMSYTPLHEAAHGNIHGQHDGRKWINDLCGYLVAPIIAIPYASHRIEHFTHHRYTNQPDKDPDFVVSGMQKGPLSLITAGLRFQWTQNTFFVTHSWQSASRMERLIYCLEIAISLGWRIAFLMLVSQPGTVLVILLAYYAGGLFTAYWFAYRPHLPYKVSERYRNTNSLIMPTWMKPVEWFWLGQNLHSIHHLFPRVPFYHYHALHQEIEPILRTQGTPIIGIFSRKPVGSDME
ncbi:MAG: fatty acid desaturase family protein [Alcanivorax sediminis]|uniref:fatty acid desaturase family protein n=1 Tax=Alcanivorax sediminis TaxID=2663008 RepID=UPI003C4E8989